MDFKGTIELHGTDAAECGEFRYTANWRKGPIPYVARMMIDAGCDPSHTVDVRRNGTLCFNPMPLSWWACKQVYESDTASVTFRSYVPYDGPQEKD